MLLEFGGIEGLGSNSDRHWDLSWALGFRVYGGLSVCQGWGCKSLWAYVTA